MVETSFKHFLILRGAVGMASRQGAANKAVVTLGLLGMGSNPSAASVL